MQSASSTPEIRLTSVPVSLISITPDTEKLALFVARASSDQENEDVGLLRYLIRKNHWSPFMHGFATVQFDTSRVIAHQMIRHWTLACLESGDIPGIQEFSQRYAEPQGTVKYEARREADINRQSSIDDLSEEDKQWFREAQDAVEAFTFDYYRQARDRLIAKECARFLVPETTQSLLYLSGSVRSWIHFFRERCAEGAQQEVRELALMARKQIAPHVPTVAEALNWT